MPPYATALPVLAILIAPLPAAAQSVRSVLTSFGFSGEWSQDCGKPPGPDNSRRVITREGRSVRFEENLGAEYRPNRYVVRSARRLARNEVQMQVELNGETVQDLTMVKDGRRMRTMRNVASDGTVIVRDGVIVAAKRDTPWLTRCR